MAKKRKQTTEIVHVSPQALDVIREIKFQNEELYKVKDQLRQTNENLMREGVRISGEIERLRNELEAVKTAAVNELQRIAATHKPFIVQFTPREEREAART